MVTTQIRRRLADNARRVRDRIARACESAGRDPSAITLVAVTKSIEMDVIRQTLDAGLLDLGESRVQELTQRAAMIHESLARRRQAAGPGPQPPRPRWHMVGHLQRNKVKAVLPWVEVIHSLDSLRLAEEISNHAARAGRVVDVLMQLNASVEKSKFGVAVGAATHLTEQIVSLPNLRLIGLMALGPLVDDEGVSRRVFARLREVFEEIISERLVSDAFRHLSMGMSRDLEAAILEGATFVRIGNALFDGLGHASDEERV